MTRRVVSWTIVLLTALVLQSTVFSQLRLGGAKPDLVYLATISLAYLEGPSSGAIAGFFGGMLEDFLTNQPKGITALTLTLLGYVVGNARQYVTSTNPLVPTAVVGLATAAGMLFSQIVSFLLGTGVGFFDVFRLAILTGVYNAILAPVLFPVIRRVAESSRPSRVFR